MNAKDIELALRSRAAFNASIERIDADTRRRLRQLRLRAQHDESRRASTRWMWPAGAALTTALALVAFMPRMPYMHATATPAATTTIAQPAAILAAVAHVPGKATTIGEVAATDPLETADPDMLSNLDFYGWLAKQPSTNATGD